MASKFLAWALAPGKLDLDSRSAVRWMRLAIWPAVAALCALRFFQLRADFPNWSLWMIDQAKFTDEGWWGSAAVMHALTGHWYVSGDYNPAVALPVWPVLLGVLFHFTGVSVVAARALEVTASIATLGVVFALVRRYTRPGAEAPALLAALLLAASPFAFVFSRLAILDTLVALEVCLSLLLASFATAKRGWVLAVLTATITIMLLTKTTAVLAIPAIFWLAWTAMGRKRAASLWVALSVAVVPAILVKSYAILVAALGYGADYKYFFDVNAMEDFSWRNLLATFGDFIVNCFWIDRVLYPVGVLILALTVWKRKLWSNPLFASMWMVLGAEAVYIFRRQEDFAPRYFLVMLAPLVYVAVLALDEVVQHSRKTAALLLLAMAASVAANGSMLFDFATHREYRLYDAASSIRKIVQSDPTQKQLILGVSGSQISLMTGIPSLNDTFGTEDLARKVARSQPGWYLTWNAIAPEDEAMLSPFRMEKTASYPVFDDDDRSLLVLYKMVRREGASADLAQPAAQNANGAAIHR